MMKILLIILGVVISIKLLVLAEILQEVTTQSEYWQRYQSYSAYPLPRK